jgi:integrase
MTATPPVTDTMLFCQLANPHECLNNPLTSDPNLHKVDTHSKCQLGRAKMNEVDAIKKDQIPAVEMLLAKHSGQIYADIWTFGINTALRISDLLSLKMADVQDAATITIHEQKTGKARTITLNSKAREIIARRASDNPDHTWLFQATGNRAKSSCKAIARQTVAKQFFVIGEIIGKNLGTHSMRKTRGKAMYQDGVPVEVISKLLNHATTQVTLRYIGIDKETIAKTYDDYVL